MLGVGFQQIQHISYIIFFLHSKVWVGQGRKYYWFHEKFRPMKKGTYLIILPHLQRLGNWKMIVKYKNEMHAIFDHMPNLKIQFAAFDKIIKWCIVINSDASASFWMLKTL